MVKVCDCIMGSGKTSASIAYINAHDDEKFIYITPYLDEAQRIKDGCPSLQFVEPSNTLAEYGFKKTEHTAALIKRGRNITTTHQAFKCYTSDMLNDIRSMEYTLIIDESVDVLEAFTFNPSDLKLAVDAGYVSEVNGVYTLKKDEYGGGALSEMFRLLRSREIVRVDGKKDTAFYWALPPDLFSSFKDVFILTYLFDGQSLCYFLKMYNIGYQRIGIHRTGDGTYMFGDYPGYIPEYVNHMRDKFTIISSEKLNAIGEENTALSMRWFDRNKDGVAQLRKNISNCYNNIWRDVPADRRLWGSYSGACKKVRGKGYSKAFVTFNTKATNIYRKRDYLVYLANIFMNVGERTFYEKHGIQVDEDMYALSVMVQWIWRSAIRDGGNITLYIPSKRMRTLLMDWIDKVSEGGDTRE